MAGPTIEWLEPKLPDILKNGSSSLGSFTTEGGALEGSRLELSSPESCSFSGVRPASLVFSCLLILPKNIYLPFKLRKAVTVSQIINKHLLSTSRAI